MKLFRKLALGSALILLCVAGISFAHAHDAGSPDLPPQASRATAAGHPLDAAVVPTVVPLATIAASLRVGDLVFTRIPFAPFTRITEVTGGWSNHVGVVIDVSGTEPLIAESKVPLSTITPLSAFLRRSDHGRAAVLRPPEALTMEQQARLRHAVEQRLGTFYDTGFNLQSARQFCSRFVREVLADATGHHYGEVQRFDELLAAHPEADQRFWRLWYFGSIPWQRVTVTPESIRRDARLIAIFDGQIRSARL